MDFPFDLQELPALCDYRVSACSGSGGGAGAGAKLFGLEGTSWELAWAWVRWKLSVGEVGRKAGGRLVFASLQRPGPRDEGFFSFLYGLHPQDLLWVPGSCVCVSASPSHAWCPKAHKVLQPVSG